MNTRISIVALLAAALNGLSVNSHAAVQVTPDATYLGLSGRFTGTCSLSTPIRMFIPDSPGRYPVYIHTVGTNQRIGDATTTALLRTMADRGFLAATIEYPNNADEGCQAVENKMECMFSPSSPSNAVSIICAHPSADCSQGIITSGVSQGGQIALMSRNFEPRVKAAYAISSGDLLDFSGSTINMSACINFPPAGSRSLPNDKIRIVNGMLDPYFGQGTPEGTRAALERVTGLTCGADAWSCTSAGNHGWYEVQPIDLLGTSPPDHDYFRDDAWSAPYTFAWSMIPNLEWLASQITGTPSRGYAQFKFRTFSADAGSASAIVTVSRTGGGAGAASIQVETHDDTGVAGIDYVATQGTLTWGDGDMSDKSLTIPLLNNGSPGGKSIHVSLHSTVGVTLGAPNDIPLSFTSAGPTAPSITQQPQDQPVSVGQTATFSVIASGTLPLTYQWKKNGVDILNATADSYTTPATTLSDNGALFTVVVNNAAAQPITSTAATLTVNTLPTIAAPVLSPDGGSFTNSVSVTITCATAGAVIHYTLDGSAPSTASAVYSTALTFNSNTTLRTIAVKTGMNDSVETARTFTVTALIAPSITQQPQDQPVSVGQTATFSVIASGTLPLTYQWKKNGVDILNATADSYTTPATTLSDNGALFTVVVNNAAAQPVTSTAATLTVNAEPTATLPTPVPQWPSRVLSTDTLLLVYTVAVDRFEWSFVSTIAGSSQGRLKTQAATASYVTASPSLNLSLQSIQPGTYSVQVRAVASSGQTSDWSQPVQLLVSAGASSSVRVYPNPMRQDRGDTTVTFADLPENSTVKIFTISGKFIRTLNSSNGVAVWDCKTESGNSAASGIYLYTVTDSSNQRSRGKFSLIR